VNDFCGFGELLVDFTPAGAGGEMLFAVNPGGGVANMTAMLAKLGGGASFVGKVGDDAFGRFLEKALVEAGVEARGLVKDPAYLTTLAIVSLSESGERDFSFYRKEGADLMLAWEEVNRAIIDEARVFHFGAVSLSDEPCRTTTRLAVEYAKARGKIISFDPNYRRFLWKSEAEAKAEIARLAPLADIIKVSQEELRFLVGAEDPEEGSRALAESGAAIALVSLGERGAFFRCARGSGRVKAPPVKAVDTTGAGDAFLGAVHYCLRGKSLEELRDISPQELARAVSFACAAGSLTATRKGGIPAMPTLAEIGLVRQLG